MANWASVDNSFDGESFKSADMKIGESIEGKVTAIEESKTYPGAFHMFLDNAGEISRIFTSGSLSYKIKDGKIAVGNTYRITRLADTPPKQKGSKARTTYEVVVDRDTMKAALPAI